jgi:hypothetical protein
VGEYQLAQAMLPLSVANSWQEAKLEWALAEVYRQDEPDTCLCGHFPINEICVLQNKKNGNRAEVGNVCVKKFLGLPSDRIFQAIRRVAEDPARALNAETILHAHQRGWISDWERTFYLDTVRKRVLTEKQAAKRLEVNNRILRATRRSRQLKSSPLLRL